jgi:hypothetical protein
MVAVGLLLVASWVAQAGDAHAQPKTVSDQLGELGKAVSDLREQTVQIPTLAAAVQELSGRVSELERRLFELERGQASIPDAVATLDTLRGQVEVLERELEGLRTELANIEQSPARASSGGGVAYQDKFSFSTADQRFAIAFSGYLHTRYELASQDGEIDASTLRIRRARVGLAGHLGSPRIKYKLLISAIRDKPLLDYYMDYQVQDWLTVRVGQYKTQFTREFITSSSKLAFLEAPVAVDLLRYDRDIQVGVYGEVLGRRIGYYLGVGNGAGLAKVNDNLDMSISARADVVALGERFKYGHGDTARTSVPTLMLGAGLVHDLTPMPAQVGGIAVNTDVDGDGDIDNVRAISASADAAFRYRGLEAIVEAVFRKETYGTILEHVDNAALAAALGDGDHDYLDVYGQVTYVLPVELRSYHLLVGGRVGRSEVPFLGLGGRSSNLPQGEHVFEADALVQLYNGAGYRFLGLMVSRHDYSAFDADTEGLTRYRVILESQLKF